MADDDDNFDDTPPKASLLKRAALGLGLLGLVLGMGLLISSFLGPTGNAKPGPQQIALIKQPPPPPPPKPPEKLPEPQKIKEEVKIDQPKPEPQPDEPKQADPKPASEQPLGVDAAGAAGSDGFGLVGSKGGRDLLSTGGGGGGASGAYYSGLLQRQFFDAMMRNRKVLKEEFRVVVKIWLGDDGRVQRSEIVSGSGSPGVDQLIQTTLAEMSPLREVPPASMRPMQVRLSNRS